MTHCPPPPRQHTPAVVSAPAKEKRAPDREERTQQSNWEQDYTHGGGTSPSRTQSDAQGDHEERAPQPPNAVDAKRAISNQPPPSFHEVPANSTRAGAGPARRGGCHGGGNRAVTSPPRGVQSTSCGDVKSSCRGAGGWDRSGG